MTGLTGSRNTLVFYHHYPCLVDGLKILFPVLQDKVLRQPLVIMSIINAPYKGRIVQELLQVALVDIVQPAAISRYNSEILSVCSFIDNVY